MRRFEAIDYIRSGRARKDLLEGLGTENKRYEKCSLVLGRTTRPGTYSDPEIYKDNYWIVLALRNDTIQEFRFFDVAKGYLLESPNSTIYGGRLILQYDSQSCEEINIWRWNDN